MKTLILIPIILSFVLILPFISNAQKKRNDNYNDPIYEKVEHKKQDSVHVIYFEIAKNSVQGYTQTDSINVLVFQNKQNPKKIEILKTGKTIQIKYKSAHYGDKDYSIRGKLTAITDTSLVMDNKYVVLGSDLISDFRFNNHRSEKILQGTAGVIVFYFGSIFTSMLIALPPEPLGAIVLFGSVAAIGGVTAGTAFTKNKHRANSWNISIKRIKK